jgi:4-hydroxy-tetrahydrodipicolinate reductase
MNFVLLGAGKTGSIVADIARDRGHQITVVEEAENLNGSWLTPENLKGVDAVIDFTTPHAVIGNIVHATRAGANMVVGTTGWYEQAAKVKELVDLHHTGFVWASNFSIGVNLFFEIVKQAAKALPYGYTASIMERHHVHKKDAPSGTAVSIQRLVEEVASDKVEIASVREGETVGLHVLMLDSEADSILLTHDAKNRRGFAEGAVRAAEWVAGKQGFYEFKDIFSEI